jgi:hypothetical protein
MSKEELEASAQEVLHKKERAQNALDAFTKVSFTYTILATNSSSMGGFVQLYDVCI